MPRDVHHLYRRPYAVQYIYYCDPSHPENCREREKERWMDVLLPRRKQERNSGRAKWWNWCAPNRNWKNTTLAKLWDSRERNISAGRWRGRIKLWKSSHFSVYQKNREGKEEENETAHGSLRLAARHILLHLHPPQLNYLILTWAFLCSTTLVVCSG